MDSFILQARHIGWLLAVPILVAAGIAIWALLDSVFWAHSGQPVWSMLLVSTFEIAAGILIATSVTGDQLVELHDSTPGLFRRSQTARAALITASSAIGGAMVFSSMHVSGLWPRDAGWVSVVSPIGAIVALASVAFLTSAYSASQPPVMISVCAAWLFLVFLWDPNVVPILAQRGPPALVAFVFIFVAWRRLGNTEANASSRSVL